MSILIHFLWVLSQIISFSFHRQKNTSTDSFIYHGLSLRSDLFAWCEIIFSRIKLHLPSATPEKDTKVRSGELMTTIAPTKSNNNLDKECEWRKMLLSRKMLFIGLLKNFVFFFFFIERNMKLVLWFRNFMNKLSSPCDSFFPVQ